MYTAERYFIAMDALLLVIWQEQRVILAPNVLFDVDLFMEQNVLLRPPVTDRAFWRAAETVVKHVLALAGRRPLSKNSMRLMQLCWRLELRRLLIDACNQRGVDYELP